MTTDIKGRKICPSCYEQYHEEDNYCGNDGARLVTVDFDAIEPAPRPVSDSVSPSGSEKS